MKRAPLTAAWREKVRRRLNERGDRNELAAYLAKQMGGTVESRRVQLARVLNNGVQPRAEFLLTISAWLK